MFCKECGKPLRGRADKRFCNSDCRSSYHNQRRRKALKTNRISFFPKVSEVDLQFLERQYRGLINNRKILKGLFQKGIFCTAVQELERLGFDFDLYTHSFVGVRGEEIRCCYDQVYFIDEGGEVILLPPVKFMLRTLPPDAFAL